ncbi:aromatic amino acid lyase [Streptomyces sp. 150FB]|uniref:aromatic amino acid lyase n=1 Tax=Streptomyces sp. 150FB TaxID=1576605 RepID=UPI00099CDF89|nr:aromatic amino acid lyase [Streptomyces sp. 150FB]
MSAIPDEPSPRSGPEASSDVVRVRTPEDLDASALARIAGGSRIALDPALLDRVRANRAVVLAALADGEVAVYGVNTGMGRLSDRRLSTADQAEHQTRLLIARAVGGPPWLPVPDARAVLAVKLRALLSEESGVGPELCAYVVARLNDGLTPAIPREGIGSAGEIIPLSHAFQTLLGIGYVLQGADGSDGMAGVGGRVIPAARALERRAAEPVRLGPKEGVSLIQGSPMATTHAVLRGLEAASAVRHQTYATACTIDALAAPREIYDPAVTAGHDDILGDILRDLRRLTAEGSVRDVLQAPVSVRVAPQALAHATRTLDDLREAADRMLHAVTDSPAFLSGRFVSTGGYHAVELGLRMDAVTAALVHLGEGSTARLHRLLDERFSGLTPQLAVDPGPQTGLVTLHKRAVGELHSLRRLAAPATLGSMDTSSGQEDFQAFAWAAGEQLREAVGRLLSITACELIAANQAQFLRDTPGSPALAPLLRAVATVVPPVVEDRPLGPEIERLVEALRDGSLLSGIAGGSVAEGPTSPGGLATA